MRAEKQKLRIAMISLYLPSGSKIGVGYQAHYLANALTCRGHELTMFSQYGGSEGALYPTVRVPVGNSMRTFRFAWNLRDIDFSSFDVIHAHTDDYWLGSRQKPPRVRTMHGACLAEAFNVPGAKERLRMVTLAASEVLATGMADRTVCVSTNTLRYFPWLKTVIPNGVDLDLFSPAAKKEPNPTILFVGTYKNRKRGRLLMQAFSERVRPALPNAQLWMVCDDAPLEPNVRVTGRITTEKLAELFRRAWIFCLPSSYEGFGVPYIEAMASGTPVVATPNVGACEVLEDGRYGVLTNPLELGTTLLDLLNSEDKRNKYRALGLVRAKEFGWNVVANAYENLYRELCES